jgi:MFS family permease
VVGLERSVLPLLAEREFGLASATSALSFLVAFGLVKAAANLAAGRLSDRFGRKPVLVAGWLFAVPVPLLVIAAPAWSWIVAANVLLGINQGLAWSTTVIMKIDLVGPSRRGLAMGLNEFAGYVAVAVSAWVAGEVAASFGLRPEPFYLGLAYAACGLGLSLLFVRETQGHARHEAAAWASQNAGASGPPSPPAGLAAGVNAGPGGGSPGFRDTFALASWRHPALSAASQAGLVNNLNDGLAWGLFPLYFAGAGLSLREIGLLAFAYPAVWGLVQLGTGALSDRVGRKPLVVWGMLLQALSLAATALVTGRTPWLAAAVLLGVGTGMVYPTLLAVVGDVASPSWRGSAVGVYRLWRDLGYAVGAVLAGVLADVFAMPVAILVVAALTLASGLVVAGRLPETRAAPRPAAAAPARGSA